MMMSEEGRAYLKKKLAELNFITGTAEEQLKYIKKDKVFKYEVNGLQIEDHVDENTHYSIMLIEGEVFDKGNSDKDKKLTLEELSRQGIETFKHEYFTCSDIKNRMEENGYQTKDGYSSQGISKLLNNLGFNVKPKKLHKKTRRVVSWENEDFFINILNKFIPDLEMMKGYEVTRVTIDTKTLENIELSKNDGSNSLRNPRNLRNLVTKHIEKSPQEIKVSDLMVSFKNEELNEVENIISQMKVNGEIFEHKKGYIKRV